MKRFLILAPALALAGFTLAACTLGQPIHTADTDRGLFHRDRAEEAEAKPAPVAAPPPRTAAPAPRAVAEVRPVAPAPPAAATTDSAIIATGPRVATAPPAPAAPPPGPSDTIATNSRSVTAPATVLNDDEIPDAPTAAAAPPDPARFAEALAPSSSGYGKPQQLETRLGPAEARARLQDRLTALNWPAPNSSKDGFGGGPLLRNPGGFRVEADCPSAGGKPVMQAAWVRVKLKGDRRAEVEVSTRFEEVQESPVRGLLVRVECRSTGRLEEDLLATLK